MCQIDARRTASRLFDLFGAPDRNTPTSASFYGADLKDVNLFGADLRNCSFAWCSLKNATLACALIDGADIRRADLDGTDLLYTDVKRASLDNAIITPASMIPGIKVVAA
jgi:uncharacterized protein YjbI with pentapeptide repeats